MIASHRPLPKVEVTVRIIEEDPEDHSDGLADWFHLRPCYFHKASFIQRTQNSKRGLSSLQDLLRAMREASAPLIISLLSHLIDDETKGYSSVATIPYSLLYILTHHVKDILYEFLPSTVVGTEVTVIERSFLTCKPLRLETNSLI